MTTTTQRYGATRGEWEHFTYVLGLTPDLLTIVSNPHVPISATSGMGKLGQIPSQLNAAGQAVGSAGWTNRTATERDIERWANIPDYGIGLQTRGDVRAIDVDITDPVLAASVRQAIVDFLGFTPPCRSRANSSKFVFAISLPGEYSKRVIRTKQTTGELDKQGNPRRHIIEFLADGQQFVVAGTHPSGARYEWLPSLPLGFPAVTPEQFDSLWFYLAEVFGHESTEQRASVGALVPRKSTDANDPLVPWLFGKGIVLEEDSRSGRLDITCPFADEHSSESSSSATSYFPAGVGGFGQGHFKCQHAHCATRTDEEFIAALGDPIVEAFEVLEPLVPAKTPAPAEPDIADLFGTVTQPPPPVVLLPQWDGVTLRKVLIADKKGKIASSLEMLAIALSSHKFSGFRLGLDGFRAEIMIAEKDTDDWRAFVDEDYAALRIVFEQKGFERISAEAIRDAVRFVARRHMFDSAILWADKLPQWDGVSRVEGFYRNYFGVVNEPAYAKAVSLYTWTALAGRVKSPGIQADMVPVIFGAQGIRKSTAVRKMAPSAETFTELDLAERDDNLSRKMRGCIIAEIGELRGLHSRDLEAIKAFITRAQESWVPKYREFTTKFPRRLVFIGTTNKEEFLADTTGNRRFLPVHSTFADPDAVTRDRDQLWAEALVLFAKHGVMFGDAERLAAGQHEKFMIQDEWTSVVHDWLHNPDMGADFQDVSQAAPKDAKGSIPAERPFIRIQDVLVGALGFRIREIDKRAEMRAAGVLVALGWASHKRRLPHMGTVRAWVKVRQADTDSDICHPSPDAQ